MTRYFSAAASDAPTGHRLGLRLADVLTNPPGIPVRAGVLLSLDLGAVRPELAGIAIPFLELPPCGDRVVLERADDGRWTLTDQDYAEDLASFWQVLEQETEDSLQDLADDLASEGIPLGSPVALEPSDDPSYMTPLGWEIGPEVRWLQYDRGNPPEHYCGSVSSDYYFGTVHAFYDPETKVCTLEFECT